MAGKDDYLVEPKTPPHSAFSGRQGLRAPTLSGGDQEAADLS